MTSNFQVQVNATDNSGSTIATAMSWDCETIEQAEEVMADNEWQADAMNDHLTDAERKNETYIIEIVEL